MTFVISYRKVAIINVFLRPSFYIMLTDINEAMNEPIWLDTVINESIWPSASKFVVIRLYISTIIELRLKIKEPREMPIIMKPNHTII